MKILAQERRLAVLKVAAGAKVTSVAKEFNIARKTLYSWIKRYQNSSPKTKKSSLEDRYVKGKKHPRCYSYKLRSKIVREISKIPKISATLLAKKLGVGRHAVVNLLEQLNLSNLEDRKSYARLYIGPGRLDTIIKLGLVREILDNKLSVSDASRENKVARKTLYSWIRQYKEEGKIKERYIEGFDHPRSYSQEKVQSILDKVVVFPELSIHSLAKEVNLSSHGVYNVLKRYSLTYKDARIRYAGQVQPSQTAFKPAFIDRIRSVFENFVPSLAPAPPPAIKNILKVFTLSSVSSTLIFLGIASWFRMVSSASSGSEGIGLFFASMAFLTGSFFFLYSFKYYLTLAIVLSYSQSEVKGEALNGKRKGLLSWILGLNGNGQVNGQPKIENGRNGPVGLEPNLDYVSLKRHPYFSIHIPFYNEKNVVERAIAVATNFDYPSTGSGQVSGYEVILCDDSTDETTQIIREYQLKHLAKGRNLKVVENKEEGWTLTSMEVSPGVTLKHLHRTSRAGFKGGALRLALKLCDPRTEFVSIFDADFVPYPDTLELFLKYFKVQNNMSEQYRESNVAAVCGYQWHVLNKSENWITRGVRTEYAGSYVIERSGTEIYGGMKLIHGSVYAIRKDALEKVGWDTSITEDFELTLKLYNAGYKVVYTPYIQAPAECVSTLKRLIRQRMRWAEGHSHNVRKMFGKLMTNPKLTSIEKLELVYLAPYYLQAFFFLIGTFSWLLSETVFPARLPFWTSLWGWSLVLTNLFALPLMNAVGLFLEESEERDYLGLASFVALSYIMVPFQAYAAVKGFLETEEGPWFRTPKTGRITDIFTRGKFYRFISGILPGRTPAINNQPLAINHQYLALSSANNQFNSFNIKSSKGRRWVGKLLISMLLVISTTLVAFAPYIQTYAPPQEFKTGSLKLGKNTKENPLSLVKDTYASESVLDKQLRNKKKDDIFEDWSYLAVNTNKNIYQPGDKVKISMAALDQSGNMVCDAALKLSITNSQSSTKEELTTKNGLIKVNAEVCNSHEVTSQADFEAEYEIKNLGNYEIELITQKDGKVKNTFTKFQVVEGIKFSVERTAPSRVWPFNIYEMKIVVKPQENFKGVVEELLPQNIIIKETSAGIEKAGDKQRLTWNVNWQKGGEYELKYSFDPSDKKPDFFEVGPLTIREKGFLGFKANFREQRNWQIAVDAAVAVTSANNNRQAQGARTIVRNSSGIPYIIVEDYTEASIKVFKGNVTTTTNTSYFDGSDSPASDPNNVWNNETNADDGDTGTYADTLTMGSDTSNYIKIEGTNTSEIDQITMVEARVYGNVSIGGGMERVNAAIYTDGKVTNLGTAFVVGGGMRWGDYVTLTRPTGGWTTSSLQSLEVYIYATDLQSEATANVARVEIRVTTVTNATPTSYIEQDASHNPDATAYGSPSATIDSSDIIHIVFAEYVSGSSDLEYVQFNTATDVFQNAATINLDLGAEDTAITNISTAIAIDANDIPHVVVASNFKVGGSTNRTTQYNNRIGGVWNASMIEVEGATAGRNTRFPDITIDADNIPEIAYNNFSDKTWTAAIGNANDASSFTLTDLHTSAGGTPADGPSIAVDSFGNTYVAYEDIASLSPVDLELEIRKHNYGDDWGTWQTAELVDGSFSTTAGSPFVSLVIDRTNRYIVAEDPDTNDIVYYYDTGGGWTSGGTLETGTYNTPKAKWAFWVDNGSGGRLVNSSFAPGEFDSYDGTGTTWMFNSSCCRYQSFTVSKTATLKSIVFSLHISSGSPTGSSYAKIYNHAGTYGISSTHTGSPLATSDPIDVSTFTGSYLDYTFNFSGANQITLTSGNYYVISFEWPNYGSPDYVGIQGANPGTHSGNLEGVSAADLHFEVNYNFSYNRTSATEIDYTFADETASPDIWWNQIVIPEKAWMFFGLGPILPYFFRRKRKEEKISLS